MDWYFLVSGCWKNTCAELWRWSLSGIWQVAVLGKEEWKKELRNLRGSGRLPHGSKEISKQFAGVPLLRGLGASVQSQLQGTEIEHQVSQGVTETRKPLYKVKNKARQQSVYLGRPGVKRIIAGGRASFH